MANGDAGETGDSSTQVENEIFDRRTYLEAMTAVSVVLAGCSESTDENSSPSNTSEPTPENTTPTESTEQDPPETTPPTAEPAVSAVRIESTRVRQTRPVTIAVDTINRGDASVELSVTLSIDGGRSDSVSLSLDPETSHTSQFELRDPRLGGQTVEATLSVDGETRDSATTEMSVQQYPPSFVKRDGTHFVRDGEQFRYAGVNNNHLNVVDWGRQYVDRLFGYLADHGISVVRTWASPPGWTETELHVGPEQFQDDWFDHFDYVLLAAKRHDIRLVLILLNNWGDANYAPTPAAYADWSPTAETKNDFFADEQANQYYRNYIEHVLTHGNQLTGVEYRNDPTILMWEVGNEIEYHDERRGEPLTEWYDAAARHIKSLDDTHLVGSGMHGATGDVYEPWNVRNAYIETHKSDAIDACSFHSYPKTRRIMDDTGEQEAFAEYVRTHIREAHTKVGKPAYFGEFGVRVGPDEQPLSKRNEFFKTASQVAQDEQLDGLQFWFAELRDPNNKGIERTHADNPLAIFPDESSSWEIIDDYANRL